MSLALRRRLGELGRLPQVLVGFGILLSATGCLSESCTVPPGGRLSLELEMDGWSSPYIGQRYHLHISSSSCYLLDSWLPQGLISCVREALLPPRAPSACAPQLARGIEGRIFFPKKERGDHFLFFGAGGAGIFLG